ncbi:GAF domain-containing protein [Halorubrum sp. CSM-61]|uniref:DUF7344 domain-containing protein n=1 Tax=Halorubrum sp. CSM-61 TaxID=2485838 RepID=UPI001F157045|nr:GAF domain-containing protein [Halorubrum sp. CSM-61]
MTHHICTSESDDELAYLQRLWRTLLAPNVDPRARLERLLETETKEFGLRYGFLSRIDLDAETERFETVHGSHEILESDTAVPLSKSYCRKTIADPEGTTAVNDARAEGWGGDPAYETFGLGSYLGTTVSVGEELYGTLCFADTAPRDEPINDKEKALVELYSQWVEYTLARRDEPSFRETRIDAIEGNAVSPEAIDTMMDTLKSRTRRRILVTLIDAGETSLSALERRFPHERDRIALYHTHVPKLADAGYVEWDAETEVVSKGPKFSEAEPLVRLLKEYRAESPE